jgi:hypothetical protein
MSKKFPINPAHPERVCWGCDLFCAAKDMRCGNGSDRTPHPVELFGEDWRDWGGSADALTDAAEAAVDPVHARGTDVPTVRR